MSLLVTSPDPPIPGVSTRIVLPCFQRKMLHKTLKSILKSINYEIK